MRTPKLKFFNRFTSEWQQVEQVSFAELDEEQGMFFFHFALHWKNQNLVQQFRRAVKSEELRTVRKVEFIYYPQPGGRAWKKVFRLRIASCWQKHGVCYVGGTVSEVLTYERV